MKDTIEVPFYIDNLDSDLYPTHPVFDEAVATKLDPISGYIEFPGKFHFYIVTLYRIARIIEWLYVGDYGKFEFHPYSIKFDGVYIYFHNNYKLVPSTFIGWVYMVIGIAKENGFESKELDISQRGIW